VRESISLVGNRFLKNIFKVRFHESVTNIAVATGCISLGMFSTWWHSLCSCVLILCLNPLIVAEFSFLNDYRDFHCCAVVFLTYSGQ
jgi:hypothetical protein